MSFRIRGLPAEHFVELFALSDEELALRRARRSRAPSGSSYPCRVSLTDAQPGDEVVLVNYEHHPVDSPYRGSFAVYVRPGEQTFDERDIVPEQLHKRLLALRSFDSEGMLVEAELCEGSNVEPCIGRLLAPSRVHYIHAFYAKFRCYAASIHRG